MITKQKTFEIEREKLVTILHSFMLLQQHLYFMGEPYKHDVGICSNASYLYFDTVEKAHLPTASVVGVLSAQWPHSVTKGYFNLHPVPNTTKGYWEGMNRELRENLLEFLIKTLYQILWEHRDYKVITFHYVSQTKEN